MSPFLGPVFVEDEPVMYRCNDCGSILEAHELDGHICPDMIEAMEDNRE
jgi:Zn finger protein HypA/HybF involved in hydrogenase expression